MPVKYRILDSHASATPKAGIKTSDYPKKKVSKGHKSGAKHEMNESKLERKSEYGSES